MMRARMRVVNNLFVCVVPVVLLLAAAPCASAGDYVWRNVKVGGGGFAPGIVFSRVERGLVYLRTDMGGAYRWDASARGWRPLRSTPMSSIWPLACIGAMARQSCGRTIAATHGRCFQRAFTWEATRTAADWVRG
jgi:hypothetical protein